MSEHQDDSSGARPSDPGPFDEFTDCNKLEAGVVDQHEGDVLLHGYSVASDLSRHYSFSELILLSLTGKPPDRRTGRAFQILSHFVAPVSVREAPVHAARLGQVVGTGPGSLTSLTAVGLAEQARAHVDECADLIDWLGDPSGVPPDCVEPRDAEDAQRATVLLEALDDIGFDTAVGDLRAGFWPSAVAVAWQCGLKSREQLIAALVSIRLPVAFAEATSVEGGDLRAYPMNLESFDYHHERGDDEQ